ncbi:sugar nucleotide-binding protein [Sphingobium sp. AntQ-1]|uniref:sugar nucleotide-binding protein n=1 Tax=Sphingobium sp. AntQ-1 TaxID=2930091 RepID=UPI00234E76DB|nr:sugar nucleotide-binding protein [Sphingobium sp. AntQ-1]
MPITGATGTLGQAFAGACLLRGIDHVLTDRQGLYLGAPRSVACALDNLSPWAVINCAGWIRVHEAKDRAKDSKAHADASLEALDRRALLVRTAAFFSPYVRQSFAMHIIEALRDGRRFAAASDGVISPTYVPDLVRAMLDLVIIVRITRRLQVSVA